MSLRPLTAAIAAVALASCMDVFQGTAPGGRASLAIAPRLSQSASLASATLAEVGVTYNSVRIVIVRPATDTLKDTTIAFSPSSPETTLDLTIAAIPGDSVEASLQFRQDNTVIFSGSKKIQTIAPTASSAAAPVEVIVDYTGPGAAADSVSIAPGPGLYSAGSSTQFTAKAYDGTSELPNTPIFWSVSDESLASISTTGLLQPTGTRGTVNVTAKAANGVAKTVTVHLAPAGAGLRIIQGAGQKGPPGSVLPLKAVVELVAADGLPAASTGQTVTFSASAGASITPATATLDANGRAEATMTVGSAAGTTYLFTATSGTFLVRWGGSAAPGIPTHFVPSGPTTLTLTAGVVPNPVPTLRVADAAENSVSGVILRITIKEGGVDVVPPFLVPADSIGLLEVYRVAPTKAGAYTVLVEAADPSLTIPSITYNVTVNPGPAAKLAFKVQPSNVVANQPMTPAVKVEVHDQFGNLVTSATGTIAISVDPATGSGVSQVGTGSETAIAGVATFSNLRFSAARTGVKIQAIGLSLPGVLSAAFNITP